MILTSTASRTPTARFCLVETLEPGILGLAEVLTGCPYSTPLLKKNRNEVLPLGHLMDDGQPQHQLKLSNYFHVYELTKD